MLAAVGHKALHNHDLCPCFKGRLSKALRGIHAFDLHGIHLHIATFIDLYNGLGIHDPLAFSVTAAIMLLHIFDPGVLTDKEAVYPVMPGHGVAAVMDPAAGDDRHIRVFAYIKIVIHHLRQPRLA